MEEYQEKPCHDLSDPKSPDFGDYMSKPPDFGVGVSKPPDFGDCMSTASTISSANSDIDDQDDNVVNSSPIAALGMDFFIYGRNCCQFFFMVCQHEAGT